MSEMEVTESRNDCSNDLLLLDRVFLRLGNADSDEQLESCISRFLGPVILKLSSSHEQVRTKVMELLVHVNRRVKCRSEVQLPVETLIQLYTDPAANSFIINFSIIYITMGFPRLSRDQQLKLAPALLEAIENRPVNHQDSILMLVMPLLGDIKDTDVNLKEKPKVSTMILKFATDLLLLPYRSLPSSGLTDFQVPPGMTLRSYKRIVDKNQIDANQLEEIKLSIVNFLSKDIFNASDILLPLIVAAADSRFNVANHANSPLIRVTSSVDWSLPSVTLPLYTLYLGSWSGAKIANEDRKVPSCCRLRLKLIQYMTKATGAGVIFPHSVQVVFSSLFDPHTNARLRNLTLTFLSNVLNNGDQEQLKKVGNVLLQGVLKVIRSDEFAEHHQKAYMCLGLLAKKSPESIPNHFVLLEELVKAIPAAAPELKTAIRDALLDMTRSFNLLITAPPERMDTSPAASTSQAMEVDDASESKKPRPSDCAFNEQHAITLFALLDFYMLSDDPMVRYVATRYAASVFPMDYIPARYLLLLASGDSQDDISTEALKSLYGTSRPSEIDDIVNNVTKKEAPVVYIGEDAAKKEREKEQEPEFKVPSFNDMANYIWDQLQKRKKGSNAKQRFVIGNHVLQFHPHTFQQILRYLRMLLNRDAGLKDCSNHPNATSPLLAKYFYDNLLDTEVLGRYLTMITSLLNASPDIMPLTCFLDIVGCVPEKMAPLYSKLLPFLDNLFKTSTKEDVRETSALIFAIITVNTSTKAAVDKKIKEFVDRAQDIKLLESQCGYIAAFSHMCERCISLSKRDKFGGKGFKPVDWEPFQQAALCLAENLAKQPVLLVGAACTAISLLVRCSALPLPNTSPQQDQLLQSENPFNINKSDASIDKEGPITKFTVADRLFRIVGNAKLPSKMKERALYTLGLMCCGEQLPFAKQIVQAFLQMAKDSREFEIHLQIGESLVLCVEGVNSNENRDLWTELPKEGDAKIKDRAALKVNDELLEWLLAELIKIGKHPHPHSRQATSIWLLALLKNCAEREPIKKILPTLQEVFMDFLSENSEVVQDVASKGLSLVYASSAGGARRELVAQVVRQLGSGRRAVPQVTDDTKLFEDGQLGQAPTGGNLSTYKELCSLASDLNQPDLLYKFMHLAHHNSVWNSKKGAAFGFHSIALQAGAQLAEHLPEIVPRLYRYRFDPTQRIQLSMASIWHAIVPNTQATVHKYHKEILEDLVTNLTSNQWRVRMSCCAALADLLRGAKSLHDSLEQLPTIWCKLFRVMDDVHEGTRQSATSTANILSKLCIQASDVSQGKDGKEIVSAILPVLLDTGITNVVKEVRNVSLQTVSKLVSAAGASLAPFLPRLVPALLGAAGDLESAKLAYLSTALAGSDSRALLDDMRASAARHHYTTDTVVKCMPFVTIDVMKEMLPKVLELTKFPQLGTKVACAHFLVLAAHYLRTDLEPIAGKIMSNLLTGTFDRNATVRKDYAEALGQVSAYAKPQSVEKLMKKLINLYETKEDDTSRSAIALVLKSVAKAKIEHIKDNEQILAPVVFLAMHAPNDDEASKATAEMFEEIWTDMSPARESGIRQHLPALRAHIDLALNASSWTKKIQAANAIKTICKDLSTGLGDQREPLIRSVLAAIHGKTFDGKQHVIQALAELCVVAEGEAPLAGGAAGECARALLAEARKPGAAYQRHALAALGVALAHTRQDCFHQLYEIVKQVLSKDESSVSKDSDEEDNEGARQRREQLTALKEAAYELLGKAWPTDPETQEKYQFVYFEHCAAAYGASARSTQLAILASVSRVVQRLAALDAEPMDTGADTSVAALTRDRAIHNVTNYVSAIVEYTLKNSNQVRHRRDALNIMEIMVKRLKDLNRTAELEKFKVIYETYAQDLSKESSHELRAKVDNIKVYFK